MSTFDVFLISVLHPIQDYFSSYETDQSVGGRKWENAGTLASRTCLVSHVQPIILTFLFISIFCLIILTGELSESLSKIKTCVFGSPIGSQHRLVRLLFHKSEITKHKHYENYREFFQRQKLKISFHFFFIFLIFAQNIDCEYNLNRQKPPRRGGSNEYQQSVF